MGRCNEFGLQISEGCNHEMLAGDNECTCAGCGVACGGQFAGCPDVWARGQPTLMQVEMEVGRAPMFEALAAAASSNGPTTATNGATMSWPPEEPPLPPVETPWTIPQVAHEAAAATASPPPLAASARVAPASAPAPAGAHAAPAPARYPAAEAPPAQGSVSAQALADVTAELRAVTDGLKLQQSMLGDLLNGLTRQQAMMAELLDARHAELRLAMVAESLPDSVADSVAKAFAANQDELTETAAKLTATLGLDKAMTKALRQVADWSDDRFEELCVRQEKLLSKAMRAGAREAEAKAASPRSSTGRRGAAPKAAESGKRQPAKASRTSAQGTRPSRRSLGS